MLRWSGRNSVVGMTTTQPAGLADYKQFARATWASGNFPEIARRGLWGVGQHLVQRVGVGKGERVLDVACGTGNAAIRAAQSSADSCPLRYHRLQRSPPLRPARSGR